MTLPHPALRSALIAFIALNALNTAFGLVWLFVGVPLRGMDYEPGRPTAVDLLSLRAVNVTIWTLVALNLLLPGYFALRKRFAPVAGFAAAWATSPIVFWSTVWAVGVTRIALE